MDDYRGRIQKANLSDRIHFTGLMRNVDLAYQAADVHVAPSDFNEPFGQVIIEAKRAGLPSIIFPDGGMVELVEDGVDGTVCREKTEPELRRAIAWYLENPDAIAAQGAEAGSSLERLGVTRFAQEWQKVYEATSGGANRENV